MTNDTEIEECPLDELPTDALEELLVAVVDELNKRAAGGDLVAPCDVHDQSGTVH